MKPTNDSKTKKIILFKKKNIFNSNIKMPLSDFTIGKVLGKGTFGSVSIVHRNIDNQTYAMKSVKMIQLTEKEKQNALNEIRILASLNHKNIIGYKEAFFDEASQTLNIIMEYADDGDLATKIKYNLKHGLIFRENIIWNYLIQILEGINYLHENKIIHRDLKSANLFLMKDGTVKIGDLNVSTIAKMGIAFTQTGTRYHSLNLLFHYFFYLLNFYHFVFLFYTFNKIFNFSFSADKIYL